MGKLEGKWHWEWVLNSAPNWTKKNPCTKILRQKSNLNTFILYVGLVLLRLNVPQSHRFLVITSTFLGVNMSTRRRYLYFGHFSFLSGKNFQSVSCPDNSIKQQHEDCLLHVKMSLIVRKLVFGVSDQVRHKPDCTATEDS